jgi:hypothetical protein
VLSRKAQFELETAGSNEWKVEERGEEILHTGILSPEAGWSRRFPRSARAKMPVEEGNRDGRIPCVIRHSRHRTDNALDAQSQLSTGMPGLDDAVVFDNLREGDRGVTVMPPSDRGRL